MRCTWRCSRGISWTTRRTRARSTTSVRQPSPPDLLAIEFLRRGSGCIRTVALCLAIVLERALVWLSAELPFDRCFSSRPLTGAAFRWPYVGVHYKLAFEQHETPSSPEATALLNSSAHYLHLRARIEDR